MLLRINLPINYGSFANATSLNLITRKLYRELATLMNEKKSFTIAATFLNDCGIGNVNQHYDCVSIPNMGGYRFPPEPTLHSKNLIVGLVGIDEVVLGREVYKTEQDWLRNKPIIDKELKKWEKFSNKIKAVHVSNHSEKDQITRYLKIPEDMIHIVPYGVEHNLYIGESITKSDSFNKIYLYNLRLWQLQVMCEMENNFYSLKDTLPVSLNVASMILVFNNPLSLRFRMDEKRFDVDGTYNARYEVVKKRVDKSYVKGTDDRVTQPGKIAIIYTHRDDEKEYLKYISFLQSKKQLVNDVEVLDIEDLQGVTGLKAIRVSVLYSKKKNTIKEYYTYEDLMKEIGE